MLEELYIASGCRNILKNTPSECPVPPPDFSKWLDCVQESLALVQESLIFNSDQHGAAVTVRFLHRGGMWPMIRRRQIGCFASTQAELSNCNRRQYRASCRDQEGRRRTCLCGNPAPDDTAECHGGGKYHNVKRQRAAPDPTGNRDLCRHLQRRQNANPRRTANYHDAIQRRFVPDRCQKHHGQGKNDARYKHQAITREMQVQAWQNHNDADGSYTDKSQKKSIGRGIASEFIPSNQRKQRPD